MENVLGKHLLHIIICLGVIFLPHQVQAETFRGEVIKILDGDTVDVLVKRTPVRIRLAEIDAPEKSQPYGQRSRQALSAIVFRKVVDVVTSDKDRYGRVIGTLFLQGNNVNKEMVRLGMAWAYPAYLTDLDYVVVEAGAREARIGLWAEMNPQSPWEFRKEQRARRLAK